jgi:hypothetical protein
MAPRLGPPAGAVVYRREGAERDHLSQGFYEHDFDPFVPQTVPHGLFSHANRVTLNLQTRFPSGFPSMRPTRFELATFGLKGRRSFAL